MNLFYGEHGRHAFRSAGAHSVDRELKRFQEHISVEEEESVEGLVLGRGSDVLFDGQVSEKELDLFLAHVFRVAFSVEEHKAADPGEVLFFGAVGIVFTAQDEACVVEQFIHRRGNHDYPL
jgi:hypothetical protein